MMPRASSPRARRTTSASWWIARAMRTCTHWTQLSDSLPIFSRWCSSMRRPAAMSVCGASPRAHSTMDSSSSRRSDDPAPQEGAPADRRHLEQSGCYQSNVRRFGADHFVTVPAARTKSKTCGWLARATAQQVRPCGWASRRGRSSQDGRTVDRTRRGRHAPGIGAGGQRAATRVAIGATSAIPAGSSADGRRSVGEAAPVDVGVRSPWRRLHLHRHRRPVLLHRKKRHENPCSIGTAAASSSGTRGAHVAPLR